MSGWKIYNGANTHLDQPQVLTQFPINRIEYIVYEYPPFMKIKHVLIRCDLSTITIRVKFTDEKNINPEKFSNVVKYGRLEQHPGEIIYIGYSNTLSSSEELGEVISMIDQIAPLGHPEELFKHLEKTSSFLTFMRCLLDRQSVTTKEK